MTFPGHFLRSITDIKQVILHFNNLLVYSTHSNVFFKMQHPALINADTSITETA